MSAAPALRLHGVRHRYGPTTVLEDIELGVRAGEVVALVGPSGCGKTTLLHLAAGLLAVQEGRIVQGFERPAVMFQQPRLLPWQRGVDNIALGLRAAGLGRHEARRRAAVMGRAMGLDDEALQAYPTQLSGGMQSRAALARALVTEPDLLLMDEPFAALDIGLRGQMHELLRRHVREHGTAVLMITHDLTEAARLAGEVLVMGGTPGRIVHRWTPEDNGQGPGDAVAHRAVAALLQRSAVREAFGLAAAPAR
ncbi:ABC transporter ATP-binding protein [Piscinibacter sp.]|uniref:ABC transporter ATP-binding protein n=1 Tax=Piscinibacter sp. TaxID=1903157 RepID=UPI0039E3D3D0